MTDQSCYDSAAERKARGMGKSVREQVESAVSKWMTAIREYENAISDPTLDEELSLNRIDDARYLAATVLNEHAELFASAEDTAAALAASQAEVSRLRGVMAIAAHSIDALMFLNKPDLLRGLVLARDQLRAALAPQPVENQGGDFRLSDDPTEYF